MYAFSIYFFSSILAAIHLFIHSFIHSVILILILVLFLCFGVKLHQPYTDIGQTTLSSQLPFIFCYELCFKKTMWVNMRNDVNIFFSSTAFSLSSVVCFFIWKRRWMIEINNWLCNVQNEEIVENALCDLCMKW